VRTGIDRIGSGEELSFYQPVHQKRLINGFAARVPWVALDYYRRSPALMLLAGETPPPGDIEADFRHRLRELRVGYVVVHRDMIPREQLPKIVALIQSSGDLSPLEDSDSIIGYRRQ
jgi:hypothetical protein